MLYLIVLVLFAVAALVTSGFAHTPKAWRYAMAATVLCAALLAYWSAQLLQQFVRYVGGNLDLGAAAAATALPFAALLLRLWNRRRHTPRHNPSPEDDPVYRRFREEKIRRRRLQRQQEEMLENSSEPLGPEAKGQ